MQIGRSINITKRVNNKIIGPCYIKVVNIYPFFKVFFYKEKKRSKFIFINWFNRIFHRYNIFYSTIILQDKVYMDIRKTYSISSDYDDEELPNIAVFQISYLKAVDKYKETHEKLIKIKEIEEQINNLIEGDLY